MVGIIGAKKDIRHAVEKPLNDIMKAQSPPIAIQWPGLALTNQGVQPWIAVGFNFPHPRITEIGPNPRNEWKFSITANIRTPANGGADANDNIAALVEQAYPYASVLTHGVARVYVDKISTGAYGIDGAWLTALVNVEFTTYRRPSDA